VTGVHKPGGDAGNGLEGFIVIERLELAADLGCVQLGVKRFDRRLAALGAFLVDELGVVFLDVTGIPQHDIGQAGGGGGGEDRTCEAALDQVGQVAAVVNVGMGQDDCIEAGRVEWELQVPCVCLSARTLEKPTFEQQAATVDFQQVLGAGDGTGGAMEVDFHIILP
jgi:hypothetical protein